MQENICELFVKIEPNALYIATSSLTKYFVMNTERGPSQFHFVIYLPIVTICAIDHPLETKVHLCDCLLEVGGYWELIVTSPLSILK